MDKTSVRFLVETKIPIVDKDFVNFFPEIGVPMQHKRNIVTISEEAAQDFPAWIRKKVEDGGGILISCARLVDNG